MKAPLIIAMLVTFAASASAGTPAKLPASNESLPAQIAYRDCEYLPEYLPKERIANLALNAQPKCRDSRRPCQSDEALYARMRRTFFFGVAY